MQKNEQISALILAGGRGSRMGHVDKGLQPFQGATMVAHVLERLAPQVGAIAINANQNLARYEAFGVPVWPDETTGFAGPLAGLEAGMRHCATPYMVTAPCDSPFLPRDLAARLFHALQSQRADVALAVTQEVGMRKQPHPVFCLVKTRLLQVLSSYLAEGGRKMDGWYADLKVAEVQFDDNDAFRNINTLDELHSLDTARAPKRLHDVTSCLSGYDPDALPVRDAQRIIREFVSPIASIEKVALRAALDRVLARDITSPISVPAHDNSAMDGFALRGADLRADGPTTLKVVDTVYAGRPSGATPAAGECVRIMTGGVMPAGCDSVVPQEFVARIGEADITVDAGVIRVGDNRRFAGEDLMAGSAALKKGRIIRPADLGLLASLGIAEVPVQRRLRVAFFSTGDELRSIGEPLDAGCVYDSNRYTLYGMLQRLGCDIIDMGVVKDDPQALEEALRNACENADAIVTSGGVSVGAADYTRDIMARLGDVTFWKIGMRPGRPLAFGKINSNGHSAFLFGLPGNPVAVMVSFYFFARAALLYMMGADAPLPLLKVKSAAAIRKKTGRTEYQRGILAHDANGGQHVSITGSQGSGILRSMSEANCMVVLHDEQGNVAAGDLVDVMLFEGLV
ncbi:molybdenum cofactor guanylyltransferase [Massilia eurypsychrophila]|uniref:Molybdenum cofactor guanylyltransferase n=1 Tax=Massilia eurypsychrophila TaxID=1485217 RepID=A0A2G8T9V4_9BURK|nr:gephyrin-like molybdotransferase Glp [Massilia eurypsychrophila]PIL42774.1 molybdenum cofactor guanylyltransferase [Massilia eurypsychrophila]